MIKLKRCSKCHEEKEITDFYIQRKATKTTAAYAYSQCKVCSLKDSHLRYSPLRDYKFKLKRKYGLSWDEYLVLYHSQQGRCKICDIFLQLPGNINAERMKAGVIDHSHDTGKIRGLLCVNCNVGIGLLQDDLDIVEKAFKYLKVHD